MLCIIGCSVFIVVAMQKDSKRMRRGKSKPCVMSNLLIMHFIAKKRVMGKETKKLW